MIKRLLFGGGLAGALVAAFLLGGLTLGVVGAQAPTTTTTPQPTATTAPAAPAAPAASQPAAPQPQATQEQQQPSYSGSVKAPQDQKGVSEQAEAKALAGLAKINAGQAKAAALAQFPGATVGNVELDNENGNVVYSVQLTDKSGKGQDVKVDAGNGKVLATEAGGPESTEGHEAVDKGGAPEKGETQG